MNKVLNINLGGVAFTIDDQAYHHLENYLQSLHNHFRESEGYEEIMSDIEARLAELMQEGMGKRSITTLQDVKNAVSIMGKPEDFGAEPISETQNAKAKTQNTANTEGSKSSSIATGSGIKTGKRLFRDEQNKAISGVCSGLAAYFGIEEVVWVRLAFVLMFFTIGSGALLYIILWAVIPKAETTADRLAMKGEPIDVNTIAKSVEKGFESFSEKVNEFGKPENQAKFSNQIQTGVSRFTDTIGGVFSSIFGALGGVGRIVVIVIASILTLTLVVSWIAMTVGTVAAKPFFGYVTDNTWLTQIAALNAFIIFAVPTFGFILLLRRLIFKREIATGWHIGMWVAFAASIFSLASIGGNFSQNFRHSAGPIERTTLPNDLQTLNIAIAPSAYGDISTEVFDVKVSDEYLLSEDIRLNIEKSDNGEFELVTKRLADGVNSAEARDLANRIDYTPSVSNGVLTLRPNFIIPQGTKWRNQQVKLTLKVPVGKIVRYNRDDVGLINWVEQDQDDDYDSDCFRSDERAWQMTPNGFICVVKDRDRTKKKKKNDDDAEE